MRISIATAERIGNELGIRWDRIPLHQFFRGMQVETEHGRAVHGDLLTIGRIARDHLQERVDYYVLLDRLEQAPAVAVRKNPSEHARTPPERVREAARQGLRLRKQYGRGGTSVGLARARQLAAGRPVSDRDIKSMYSFFRRHAGDRLDLRDPPSNGWIAWLLWGGDPARRWIERLRPQVLPPPKS